MTELPTKEGTQFCEVGHSTFTDLIEKNFRVQRDLVATASNIYY